MSVLKSKLFILTDPSTSDKLEACATGQPNEWSTHFAVNANANGEHIRLVQKALKRVRSAEPSLGLPEITVDGKYSQNFANAVKIYKKGRGIKNVAGKIDDIVGIKTLRRLDEDVDDGIPPNPNPAPDPPFRESRITKRVFVRVERSGGGRGGPEDEKDLLKGVQEFFNSFNDPEAAFGEEKAHERKVEIFEESFRVNLIEQRQDIKVTQSMTLGDPITLTIIKTEFVYKYGPGNPTVVMDIRRHVEHSGMVIDRHEVETKSREEANKKILWTPPKP